MNFRNASVRLRQRKVSNGELRRSNAAIAILLMFKSWQRLGAVANMMVHEFLHCHLVKESEEIVKQHKMQMSSSSKLVLNLEDFSKVQAHMPISSSHFSAPPPQL